MTYGSNNFKEIDECRTCFSKNLEMILDLGKHPLANALRDSEVYEERYPLELIGCLDCRLLQLSINVNPEIMFQEYLWVTGTSDAARNYCKDLAFKISEIVNVESNNLLEIGSNDGTLLKEISNTNKFKSLFGVDPAKNINEANNKANESITYLTDFFDERFVDKFLESNPEIDVVVARNVLSHVPDLHKVLNGISKISTKNADLVIEFHESSIILRELHYDSIYHEHTYYHNLKSMEELLISHGFYPYHLEISPISGGSYVLFSSKLKKEKSLELLNGQAKENQDKINEPSTWHNFALQVKRNIDDNIKVLEKLSNKNSCAYGASARSSTLLNTFKFGKETFKGLADKNPLKWGKLSPGIGLTIDNPENLIDSEIRNIFITAFNFEPEIVKELRDVYRWSGRIYLPLPNDPREYTV